LHIEISLFLIAGLAEKSDTRKHSSWSDQLLYEEDMRLPTVIRTTLGIFFLLVAVYIASPVTTVYDSRWAIHTTMSFIDGAGGSLSAYQSVIEKDDPYAIEYINGEPRTIFPIGVSILSIPAVAIISLVDPGFKGRLFEQIPYRLDKALAATYGAIAGTLFLLGDLWSVSKNLDRVSNYCNIWFLYVNVVIVNACAVAARSAGADACHHDAAVAKGENASILCSICRAAARFRLCHPTDRKYSDRHFEHLHLPKIPTLVLALCRLGFSGRCAVGLV